MSSASSMKKPYWRRVYENETKQRQSRARSDTCTTRSQTLKRRSRAGIISSPRSSIATSDRQSSGVGSTPQVRGVAMGSRSSTSAPALAHDSEEISQSGLSLKNEDSTDELIVAIDIRGKRSVGCCYYSSLEQKLYLLSDVETGGSEIAQILKTTLEPKVVLLPAHVDEEVDAVFSLRKRREEAIAGLKGDVLTEDSDAVSTVSEQYSLPYSVELLSNRDFDFEEGKHGLAALEIFSTNGIGLKLAVPGDNELQQKHDADLNIGFTTFRGRVARLAALVDLDSYLSVGCAGAILKHLKRRRAQFLMPDNTQLGSVFDIQSVGMFSMDKTMYMSADTLASLQIVEAESHPHMQNQGPNTYGSKESLSVYGLFHHLASSPQGKQRLRQAFLRPSLDMRLVIQRQNSISALLHAVNQQPKEKMIKSLKSIKNLKPVLLHLRKGINRTVSSSNKVNSSTWTNIRSFAFHALEILTAMRQLDCNEQLDIRIAVMEMFDPRRIAFIGQDITTVVDFRASAEEGRPVVNTGVDEDLDALKRTYAGIEDFLNQLSRAIVDQLPLRNLDVTLNVVTYPQIGFLIGVQRDAQSGLFPDIPESSDNAWERIFSMEHAVYYKDNHMKSLDAKYGDIAGNIYDREVEITFDLGRRILEHEDFLCRLSDICGHLDAIMALARGAALYDLRRPVLTTRNVIDIKGGRHILQERITSNFVGNDTALEGGDEGSETASMSSLESHRLPNMLLVTGPNFSGKSVYLKQVALIVYLAHVGSFVPAEAATIGLTDKIIARVATRETVSKQHSAFTIDLQQIASATNTATERSLVLIDEFGKGTNTDDGIGLSYAIIKHFISNGSAQPKVIAVTHFHELFENGLLVESGNLRFAHMAVIVSKARQINEQVTYLYELKPGRSVASYGTTCAYLNGIPSTIVDRAMAIIRLQAGRDLLTRREEPTEQEKDILAHAEYLARQFLSQEFVGPDGGRKWLIDNVSSPFTGSVQTSTTSTSRRTTSG